MYAFLVGATITAIGFSLARLDAARQAHQRRDAKLLVAGSETLRPFMHACAQAYMTKHHDIDVIVRGGGSATGIAALLVDQIDLALSSRELTEKEVHTAAQLGGALRVVPVGREAIAIITHPNVTLDVLDIRHLAAVLDGSITEWSALAADGGHVSLIARAPASGTAAIVEAHILGARAIAPTARRLETHEDVVAAVGATAGSIGYADAQVARRHAPTIKTLALRRDTGGTEHRPELDHIASGEYPLTRTLFLVAKRGTTQRVQTLIDYCTSTAAAPFIEAAGFVPAVGNITAQR